MTAVPAEIVTTEVTNLVRDGRLVGAADGKEEADTVVPGVKLVAGIVVSLALKTGAEENQGIEGVGSAEAVCGPNCRIK